MPPEHPPRRTHPDSGDRGSGDGSRKNGIGGGSRTDWDNDLQRRCPCGAAAKRGDGEATTKHRRGNKDAKAISYGAAGDRGKEAINKRITNTI